ncbi:MAG: hypothetical protein AB7V46_01850 [Thermomicrobiales bacterium]
MTITEDLDACQEMADVSDRILVSDPDIAPADFLRALGRLVAGIDPGVEGILDLARGGENAVYGRGFRPEFDDGSRGQARHFAGTAASVAIVGGRVTGFVAHTFLDPADTADGRLTTAAIDFATQILDETLPLSDASTWIVENLCVSAPEAATIRIDPPPTT